MPARVTEDQLISRLRNAGRRITFGRQAVIHALYKENDPLSAQELHALLKKEGIRIDRATAYRELQFLAEEGYIRDHLFDDGIRRYQAPAAGHTHHLVCTNCRSIQDIEMEKDLDAVERKISSEQKFTVTGHVLEFYGLCRRCTSA